MFTLQGLGSEHKGATQQAAEAILKGAPSAHTLITVSISSLVINLKEKCQAIDHANTVRLQQSILWHGLAHQL